MKMKKAIIRTLIVMMVAILGLGSIIPSLATTEENKELSLSYFRYVNGAYTNGYAIPTSSDPSEKQEPIKNITRKDTKIIDLFGFFGQNYSNLNYDNNGIIINTFKKGGDNYNESMGEINGGKHYELLLQANV